MNEQISGGNFFVGTLHSFISTLPYVFLPGAQAVFNITAANSRLIGASTGAAIGASTGDGSTFDKVLHGVIGGAAGFAAGYLAPESIAYPVMILYLKALLSIAPALTIITFGLLRFLTIILKVLSVHFLSLLILPAIFLAKNLDYLKSFSVKVFSVVLEIPLFVIAINIAVVAQMMFHSVGESFNKRVVLGMLQNNAVMSSGKEITIENLNLDNLEYLNVIKIYSLDGFMQIAIAILAVVMSYVIINKLHVMVTEFLELNAERTLDSAVDTLTNESKHFGGRI